MVEVPAVRGFVLQPTYRIEAGRPVVHLYGKLETGESFLVRDRRLVPHFYVEEAERERAAALGARPLAPAGKVTMAGRAVLRVEVPTPPDTPPLRDRLQKGGVPCYEADVRFAMRYLIDRGIRAALAIRGPARAVRGVGRVFEDPELAPADWTPRLSVLSLDIETDPQGKHLLSVALHGRDAAEVLLLVRAGESCPEGAVPLAGERALLDALCRRVRELDPDVLTGWNVAGFDLQVLQAIAAGLGVPLELGRAPGGVRLRRDRMRGRWEASVPGRLVMDGIELLRGAFIRMEDYSLDAVAREVLGEGKTLAGRNRAFDILRLYERDRARFVEYNLTDARLVSDILAKLALVELAVERSRLTGLPPDRVASSIAAFDFLYLSALARRGVVAPSVGGGAADAEEPQAGGHVLEPRPGLYENVLVFDFKSLYPSLIRTFQIDPLGLLGPQEATADAIVAPNGAAFRRRRGVITELLDELFPKREEAIRRGDKVASYAIKILMNSFYGVLGAPSCRFHNPRLANAITGFGRALLLESKERIEAGGRAVLYGDTDSLFVESGTGDPGAAEALGRELAQRLNDDLAQQIRTTWGVDSRLELEFEALYLKLFLPTVRHGKEGARKRYAGLVRGAGEPRVVLTGLEAVRRDWTDLARRVQRELYERLFRGLPVEDYLREVIEELRGGRLDDLLVYRKALRKEPEEYTASTPPHVAAARRTGARSGELVTYVMTAAGPEPADGRSSPLDYEHYLEKQVRPVADPVLEILGLDFAELAGGARQLGLFG